MNIEKRNDMINFSEIAKGEVFFHTSLGVCMRIDRTGEYHAVQLESGNLCYTTPQSGLVQRIKYSFIVGYPP